MDDTNPVLRSLDIIEGMIVEKMTVEHIAARVYFSKYHYQRMFRELMGDSVMRYVTKRRLTLAGAALLATDAGVLEVALRFGFDSHEGFTRSFKAYMGVTPTEYRKHHLAAISQKTVKGTGVMLYSKTTDGILRELNGLIAQARETAEHSRKHKEGEYAPFWAFLAGKADAMADGLQAQIERVTAISRRPDGISARFMMLKAIEDIAFGSNVTALNAGVMAARAQPEQAAAFKPTVEKYYALAGAAQLRAGKIAAFFNELAALVFEDMRKDAARRVQAAIEKGRAAAAAVPYAYIARELRAMADELSSVAQRDAYIVARCLEDYLFMLDIIAFAADADAFRDPARKDALAGIGVFRESLTEALAFFQDLAGVAGAAQDPADPGMMAKVYSDMAFQGNILLFYLRGEAQKLGDESQQAAFDDIGGLIDRAIHTAHKATDGTAFGKMAALIGEAHAAMLAQADKLGARGAAVRFLAEEVRLWAERAHSAAARPPV